MTVGVYVNQVAFEKYSFHLGWLGGGEGFIRVPRKYNVFIQELSSLDKQDDVLNECVAGVACGLSSSERSGLLRSRGLGGCHRGIAYAVTGDDCDDPASTAL
jgi:hypothetical protein